MPAYNNRPPWVVVVGRAMHLLPRWCWGDLAAASGAVVAGELLGPTGTAALFWVRWATQRQRRSVLVLLLLLLLLLLAMAWVMVALLTSATNVALMGSLVRVRSVVGALGLWAVDTYHHQQWTRRSDADSSFSSPPPPPPPPSPWTTLAALTAARRTVVPSTLYGGLHTVLALGAVVYVRSLEVTVPLAPRTRTSTMAHTVPLVGHVDVGRVLVPLQSAETVWRAVCVAWVPTRWAATLPLCTTGGLVVWVATWIPAYLVAARTTHQRRASDTVAALRRQSVHVRGHRGWSLVRRTVVHSARAGTTVYAFMAVVLGTTTGRIGAWSVVLATTDAWVTWWRTGGRRRRRQPHRSRR